MALIERHQGMEPRKGPGESHPLQDHPRRGGRPHPQGKGQEELTFPGSREQHRHKGAAHIDFPLGKLIRPKIP